MKTIRQADPLRALVGIPSPLELTLTVAEMRTLLAAQALVTRLRDEADRVYGMDGVNDRLDCDELCFGIGTAEMGLDALVEELGPHRRRAEWRD